MFNDPAFTAALRSCHQTAADHRDAVLALAETPEENKFLAQVWRVMIRMDAKQLRESISDSQQ